MNHLDLVGWINTARYKWAELMGNKIKFKPATFYLGIVDHLAKAVEGLKPEDVTAEIGGGDRRPKRGHGQILDEATQEIAPVKAEDLTKLRSTKGPGGKGKVADPSGLATSMGPCELTVTSKHHDKVTGVPPPTILDSATSTSPPRKPGADTPLPEQ